MSADPALVERCVSGFRDAFGRSPERVSFAPGRVNLIGEHTDYNDGFVLPCALPFGTVVAHAHRNDARVDALALDFNARDSFDPSSPPCAPTGDWTNHVRGVVAGLPKFGLTAGGADIAFAGDVPQGGGLSSSASLAVALGLALAGDQADRQALAKTAQWSEHHYVGCACGIMDQLASASCVAGHALLIDCRSLATRAVPMPDDAAVMIVHSGVSRELADSAYNERRAQCEAAARHYEVAALRDLDLADLEARRTGLDDIAFARARHVVTENARALAAADSLARGDLQALGTAMYASHVSLRDDFQVSVPAVDALVDVMANAIGPHGGARMTGGGFGGFVVAIVARSRMADVRDALAGHWAALGVAPPLALEVEASAGAYLVDAERPFAR